MSHYDQHMGALDTLSRLAGIKTVKAACGRRVSMSQIISKGVCNCIECREAAEKHVTNGLWLASQPYGTEESRNAVASASRALAIQFQITLPEEG